MGGETELNQPGGMPVPVVAPVNEGLWRAAAEGRLVVQRCGSCGAHRYPPIDGCPSCGGADWEWDELPGTGTVYSYTWIPDPARAGTLYNVAVVTLDGTVGDPVRILVNVVDVSGGEGLDVGRAVRLRPVPFAAELALPCFATQ